MLEEVLSGISNLALRQKIRDDDGVDQLHHFVTVTILAFFAAIAGVKEFAGEPINCWNHGNYLWKHYQDHVNSFCWTHNLYRYPNRTNLNMTPYQLNEIGARLDQNLQEDDLGKITFYRWVTVMFIVQAFLFKLPNLFWSEFNIYSGSNIVKMVEMLQDVIFTKEEDKKEKFRQVALFLEQWLRIHRKPHWFLRSNVSSFVKRTLSCCMLCIGNNISNYLSTLYLVVKFLFLINNILQFAILSAFLQLNYWHFGVETIITLTNPQRRVATTPTFPVVAVCHFQTYDNNKATGIWVQCILNINLFLEKLFLIEWFWLHLLLLITLFNFGYWCLKILNTKSAMNFVQRYMRLMEYYTAPMPESKHYSMEQFIMEYLRNDGIFVLRILAANTNDVAVAQLVEELWLRYVQLKNHNCSMDIAEAETPFVHDERHQDFPTAV